MGFFKNIFGNKSEDDASATSKPDPEKTPGTTAQPAEAKPESPPRAPESKVEKNQQISDSREQKKVVTPSVKQAQSVKAKENSQPSAKAEQQRADGPPPLNNVVELKSVSISSTPPTAKHRRVSPPAAPKAPSRDDVKKPPIPSSSTRSSEPKVSRPPVPAQSNDKKTDSVSQQTKEPQNGITPPRVRSFSKGPRESLPVSQNKAKVVGSGQQPSKNPVSSPQSHKEKSQALKEKLIASADAAASSRNGVKPRSGARVFRTAMMEAKQKSIPPQKSIPSKEPEIDLKSAVEWAFEPASQTDDARSKAAKAAIADESKRVEIRRVFAELVNKRAKIIRDFGLELSLGLTPKRWASVCRQTVNTIAQAADTLKWTELATVLAQFERQLEDANQQLGPSINPSLISELNTSYEKLAQLLPDSFGVGDAPVIRERLLVESLLLQVPGVRRNIVKQIESKQMTAYRDLCATDEDETAQKLGMDKTVAKAIYENFNAFQKAREAVDPENRIETAHRNLDALARQLDRLHGDFCRAEAEDNRENKRIARRELSTASTRIDVLLADIVELEFLKALKPLSVQKKIERIKTFLDETTPQTSSDSEGSPASKEVTA